MINHHKNTNDEQNIKKKNLNKYYKIEKINFNKLVSNIICEVSFYIL